MTFLFVRDVKPMVGMSRLGTLETRIKYEWMTHMAELDELDKAILALLQSDARRSNRDVAAAVGVSPTTALDRTRALRDRGVIRGATLDVDLPSIGRPVQAMIAVRIRPPSRRNIEGFRNWVSALPDTLGVFVTSGTEDFLVHVAVPDNNSLYAFVIDRLTERPEVADVRTSIVYEHLRSPGLAPVSR
jgi:DNA-binding Lrp family transcriptional regulator